MSDRVRLEDLPDELVEDVINSRGFQKMLAYRKLADGIEVLEDNDQLYDSMVVSILNQHSNVKSRRSVEEFFELFVKEVKNYTDGLVDDGIETKDPLEGLYVEGDAEVED